MAGLGYVLSTEILVRASSLKCVVVGTVDRMDGRPIDKSRAYDINYDVTKADRILELKYRTMEETLQDIIQDVKTRGWEVSSGSG